MTAKTSTKICELKLDDIKNVAGGATYLSTSTTLYASSSFLIKPTSTTTWSLKY